MGTNWPRTDGKLHTIDGFVDRRSPITSTLPLPPCDPPLPRSVFPGSYILSLTPLSYPLELLPFLRGPLLLLLIFHPLLSILALLSASSISLSSSLVPLVTSCLMYSLWHPQLGTVKPLLLPRGSILLPLLFIVVSRSLVTLRLLRDLNIPVSSPALFSRGALCSSPFLHSSSSYSHSLRSPFSSSPSGSLRLPRHLYFPRGALT